MFDMDLLGLPANNIIMIEHRCLLELAHILFTTNESTTYVFSQLTQARLFANRNSRASPTSFPIAVSEKASYIHDRPQ